MVNFISKQIDLNFINDIIESNLYKIELSDIDTQDKINALLMLAAKLHNNLYKSNGIGKMTSDEIWEHNCCYFINEQD